MGIKDYKPETALVPIGNTSLSLRGVSLEGLSVLMRDHLSDIDGLVAIFQNNVKTDLEVGVMVQYAMGLIREAPALVSTLIYTCDMEAQNDSDIDADDYRDLDISVQLKCLKAIAEMSFKEAGGAKKFIESFGNILHLAQPVAKL